MKTEETAFLLASACVDDAAEGVMNGDGAVAPRNADRSESPPNNVVTTTEDGGEDGVSLLTTTDAPAAAAPQPRILLRRDTPPDIIQDASTVATSSTTTSSRISISNLFLISLLVFVTGGGIGAGIYWMQQSQVEATQKPSRDLHSFIQKEKASNGLLPHQQQPHLELPTDEFKVYTAASCVEVDSFEQAQEALRMQLDDVPEHLREKVIKRALVERASQRGSTQDFDAALGTQGRASTYMAFWSTTYNGNLLLVSGGAAATYSTCVLVTGVDFLLAETVAGFEESQELVQIGVTPCDCGYWYCSAWCPEYESVTTRTPIFKRHALSLNEQQGLHKWMVQQAAESAENILLGRIGGGNNESSQRQLPGSNMAPASPWRAPNLLAFQGASSDTIYEL